MYRIRIHKGRVRGRGVAYAIVIDDAATFERLHCEYFYGHDGRTTRAEAIKWARYIHKRQSLGTMARDKYLTSNFPMIGQRLFPE